MLLKQALISLILTLQLGYGFTQDNLLWQRCIGGHGDDNIASTAVDSDNNIYLVGSVETAQNGFDIFVSKLDEGGNLIWQKEFGGERDDMGVCMLLKSNGNILVLGSTNSKDAFHPGGNNYQDIVLLIVSPNGDLLDKHFYGGDFIDMPSSITRINEGDYLISGYSRSQDGDLTGNNGQFDMWVFRIDNACNITWQKNYGSTTDDMAIKVITQQDGTFMILGQSTSYEGVYSDNHGDIDVVLLKIDYSGNIIWQKSYGGFYDDKAIDILQLENGNVLIASSTFSYQFDVESNHGGSDVWLFEVDQQSNLLWSKTYGSYGNEYVASIVQSETGFILFGTSNSSDISATYSNGKQDFWLCEINKEDHEIANLSFFGSTGFELGESLTVLGDGSILLAGNSNSNDGIVQGNKGNTDGWIIRVQRESGLDNFKVNIHPNPSDGMFYLNEIPAGAKFSLYDLNGRLLNEQVMISGSFGVLDVTGYNSGVYLLQLSLGEVLQTVRIVKN